MTLWLRAHRAHIVAMFAVATGLLVLASGDSAVPILVLIHGRAATPLALLAPLLLSVAVGWMLTLGEPAAEATAVRPIKLVATAWTLVAIFFGTAVCLLAGTAGAPFGYAGARNTLGLSGLTLVGRHFLGRDAAAVVPAGLALISALLGTSAAGQVQAWAWIADPSASSRTWLIAGALLVIGVGVSLIPARQRTMPNG